MADEELRRKLEELRAQRIQAPSVNIARGTIEPKKNAEGSAAPAHPPQVPRSGVQQAPEATQKPVNIARGIEGEKMQGKTPADAQVQKPAKKGWLAQLPWLSKPEESKPVAQAEGQKNTGQAGGQQDAGQASPPQATQAQAGQQPQKKLPSLPIPPMPPYSKPAQQPTPYHPHMHGGRQPDQHESGEEEEMAEELMPEVKKIVAYASKDAAKHEQAGSAIAAAHGTMAAAAQATQASPPQNPTPLTRREQRRLEREKQSQEGSQESQSIGATSSAANAAVKELSFEDLLGPSGKQEEKSGEASDSGGEGKSLFAQLEQVSGGSTAQAASGGAGAAERKESVTQVQVKKDEPLACPTCKAQNTRVVFCPYCGTGMCANCSPTIRPEGDFFIFTCPHCSEEVTVRKRMPAAPTQFG